MLRDKLGPLARLFDGNWTRILPSSIRGRCGLFSLNGSLYSANLYFPLSEHVFRSEGGVAGEI